MPNLPVGPRSGSIRMLAAAIAMCGAMTAFTVPARASSDKEMAQPARAKRHTGPRDHARDRAPVPAAPRIKHPVSEPSEPESRPSEPSSVPDDDEEVSPGDDPASCDGCELAVLSLGGTLWGLFGVSRRRGVPRPVIRGLQLR